MCTVSSRRVFMGVLALGVFVSLFAGNASAATVVVGTCKNLVQFSSIQSAINAVPSNSTIFICAGTYSEQLKINKSVILTGVPVGTSDAAVILPPSGGLGSNATSFSTQNPMAAHVWVLGPATVNMSNLIVDSIGNGQSGCGQPTLIGILYQNANGTLTHVTTRNQWVGASESDTGSNGCQTGLGVFVQSGTDSNGNTGTSSVTVNASSVHDYQKNGITGNEVGTTLTVNNSDVVGQGATNGAAENGIQIGFGAAGTVNGNLVIDDVWAPDTNTDPGDAAAGILLYDTTAGKATVKNNTVGNTQFGIAAVTDTSGEGDGASITANRVFGTRIFDGIDVCVNTSVVQSNIITNSSESAIHLDASCSGTGNSNTVTSNTIVDACAGILQDSGTSGNNTTTPANTFFAAETTSGSSCTPIPSTRPNLRRKTTGLRSVLYSPVRP
jgi:hypothetical protein